MHPCVVVWSVRYRDLACAVNVPDDFRTAITRAVFFSPAWGSTVWTQQKSQKRARWYVACIIPLHLRSILVTHESRAVYMGKGLFKIMPFDFDALQTLEWPILNRPYLNLVWEGRFKIGRFRWQNVCDCAFLLCLLWYFEYLKIKGVDCEKSRIYMALLWVWCVCTYDYTQACIYPLVRGYDRIVPGT